MYSKQQASQVKQEFWTAFGKYMQPIPSAEGEKINWINYKTGIKHISFKMEAARDAFISIEITHPKLEEQEECFQKFQQLKNIFHESVQEEWDWILFAQDEHGKILSRIYTELEGVNIFNKANWPTLISFFKPRIIALDEFWSMVKPGFEM